MEHQQEARHHSTTSQAPIGAANAGSASTSALPERTEAESSSSSSSSPMAPPVWISLFIERPFKVRSKTTGEFEPEATGWAMDAGARGPLNMTGTFMGAALLVLASKEARMRGTDRLYGLKPSSLLTTTAGVVAVLGAISMPIVGSIVDHTHHRKMVGAMSAFLVVLITAAQISISQSNWFIILCLDGAQAFLLMTHVTAVNAYLPDLATHEDDINYYTSGFNIRQYVNQATHSALLVVNSLLRPKPATLADGAIQTARASSTIAVISSGFLLAYSWIFLFRKRTPIRRAREGQSPVTAGLIQLNNTVRRIFSEYSALKWMLLSLLWSPEAGTGIVLSITTTFLTQFLEIESFQVAYISLIMLISSVPGSFVSRITVSRWNPLASYRWGLLMWASVVAISTIFLTGPERKQWIYLVAIAWGVCFGWVYPSQRVLFCTLIPRGQEMELMGIFAFFGNVLSWLPPLLFTMLNERGISMRWGMSLVAFFLAFALLVNLMMGNYDDAVAQVRTENPNFGRNSSSRRLADSSFMSRTDEATMPCGESQDGFSIALSQEVTISEGDDRSGKECLGVGGQVDCSERQQEEVVDEEEEDDIEVGSGGEEIHNGNKNDNDDDCYHDSKEA